MSVNRVTLEGNLGRDPIIRATRNGRSMAFFSVAVSEEYTNRQGERKELTYWPSVTAWGNLAEFIGNVFHKGSWVHVEGHITTRTYDTPDGQRHYVQEVTADKVFPWPEGYDLSGGTGQGTYQRPAASASTQQGSAAASGGAQQHGNFGQFGDPVPQQGTLPMNQPNQGGDPFPPGNTSQGADEDIPF